MSSLTPQTIFLMGPTAAGKTDLAIQLCQQIPCEIISVDSALVYKDMNIGTAKPTLAELEVAPHHLIDFLDPSQVYSAADFRKDALKLTADIIKRGRTPLFVGGTMMYFNGLLNGLSKLPEADENVRAQLALEAETLGWAGLHKILSDIDPVAGARIHENDPQRINRALEVFRITGKTLTELTTQEDEKFPYTVQQFAIAPADRAVLHQRIEKRFLNMLENGFEAEVRALYSRGDLNPNMPSIRCVGYRQMWDYIAGKTSYDEMTFKGIVASRQLAKRQLTWLRGWQNLTWLEPQSSDLTEYVLSCINSK